jgi:uncharacterized protein YifN (PemK superfamily)
MAVGAEGHKVTKQLKLPRNTRDYFVVRTWEMHRNPINSFNQYAKQIQWVWVSRTYRVSDGAQRLSERSATSRLRSGNHEFS